ncbi:large-conductance mechanosensitive channel protein MscL [Acidaminobacterium chupaoyuni]
MKKWLQEFKKFAFKGNVVDMAVGVIIGGAFGKIVSSLVNDVVMPFFGFLTAGVQFDSLKWVLSKAVVENGQVVKPEAAILYGSFLQNVVDFLIIALCVFMAVKFFNRKKEETPAPPAGPTEIELLAEIRDELKKR